MARAPATAATNREATTEQRMSANEIVLRDHQCKEKNIYKKNENIYAYICEDEEEEREPKKLTLAQMECRCNEGDELRVQTRNESKDEKESMKLCVAPSKFKVKNDL